MFIISEASHPRAAVLTAAAPEQPRHSSSRLYQKAAISCTLCVCVCFVLPKNSGLQHEAGAATIQATG